MLWMATHITGILYVDRAEHRCVGKLTIRVRKNIHLGLKINVVLNCLLFQIRIIMSLFIVIFRLNLSSELFRWNWKTEKRMIIFIWLNFQFLRVSGTESIYLFTYFLLIYLYILFFYRLTFILKIIIHINKQVFASLFLWQTYLPISSHCSTRWASGIR